MNTFEYLARHPEEAAVFDQAMAAFTALTAMAVAAAYDFSRIGTLVDVGGGNGALLIGILKANASLRGIVYDLPHVADRAVGEIAAAGLTSRCEASRGDFFERVPSAGDAYVLKHVIHDWDDARATRILANCRRAMRPQAVLLIVEGVYPPRIDQSLASRGAAANDCNMLVCTGGRQRSEAEFRSLFEGGGVSPDQDDSHARRREHHRRRARVVLRIATVQQRSVGSTGNPFSSPRRRAIDDI